MLPWYDALNARLLGESLFREHLLQLCDAQEEAFGNALTILDAGCGSGTWMLQALASGTGRQILGVDIDPRILTQAGEKLADHGGWSLLQAHLGNTGLPSGQFDLVVCSLVFHHLRSPEKIQALEEFRRLLQPGGRLLLADFAQPADWLARLRFLPVRLLDGWQRTAANVRGELPDMMSSAGFANIQCTLQVSTWLGTLCCYRAIPAPSYRRGA